MDKNDKVFPWMCVRWRTRYGLRSDSNSVASHRLDWHVEVDRARNNILHQFCYANQAMDLFRFLIFFVYNFLRVLCIFVDIFVPIQLNRLLHVRFIQKMH